MAEQTLHGPGEVVHIAVGELGVEYRLVRGWEAYAVGNDGSVWTRWKRGPGGIGSTWKPKVANENRKTGHLIQHLRPHRLVGVHALVLEAFVCPRPAGMQGCHNDGNPKNNSLSNLRWDTPKGNQADLKLHGTLQRGERHYLSMLSDEQAKQLRCRYLELRAGGKFKAPKGTTQTLADEFGLKRATVQAILHRGWKHIRESEITLSSST